jgi:hypothetical protein
MAKELTHILIAGDILGRLTESQPLLAEVLQSNASAYYLGSIVPDAFFYDLPPFRLNPKKYLWISRALHQKDKTQNDKTAMGFFASISGAPHMWRQKVAFSAGIITHTVTDRIFHDLIEYYNNAWNEEGAEAMGTHREMETLIDMALLKPRNINPRQFGFERHLALDRRTELALYDFYLAYLTGNRGSSLARLLKRAIKQQGFFMKLFTTRTLYYITKVANSAASNQLRVWHALFYPNTEEPKGSQLISKMRKSPPAITNPLDPGGLTPYTDAASAEAIRCINIAVNSLA